MRVGRPIKALPQPLCDYCSAHAAFVKYSEASYPYRDDHGALWVCTACQAWIGIHSRSTRNVPLGRLADDPSLRALMGKAARARALTHFNEAAVLARRRPG